MVEFYVHEYLQFYTTVERRISECLKNKEDSFLYETNENARLFISVPRHSFSIYRLYYFIHKIIMNYIRIPT